MCQIIAGFYRAPRRRSATTETDDGRARDTEDLSRLLTCVRTVREDAAHGSALALRKTT